MLEIKPININFFVFLEIFLIQSNSKLHIIIPVPR